MTRYLVDALAVLGAVCVLGIGLLVAGVAAGAIADHPRCPAWWRRWINQHFVAPDPAAATPKRGSASLRDSASRKSGAEPRP